jgi:Nucleotidyl transferase AbiEii toxin, Type IV TA system
LFGDAAAGPNLAFRGGTSLSKGWQCIDRFSEDVDLAINRDWVGGAETVDLSSPIPSKHQKEKLFKKLRDQCRKTVSEVIAPLLIRDMSAIVDDANSRVAVESLESARDPFVVYVRYPGAGLNPPDAYFQSTVKIELSGRAEGVPVEKREIIPYVHAGFPQLASGQTTVIPCVRPDRTFWEKAALLHEQNSKTPQTEPANRLSRHLYDLHQLWTVGGLSAATSTADPMFKIVMNHRRSFFPYGQVNHLELKARDLMLRPPPETMATWKADFKKMRSMFFGDPPSFEQVLETINEIQESFRRVAG